MRILKGSRFGHAFVTSSALGVLASSYPIAAYASAPALSQPISSPDAPLLSVACVPMPAHTDYVRITYVAADGETAAGAESSLSQPADALTIVRSPPRQPGAIGYNVYAILNNGGSGTGETLQNASPIAFGADFREPDNGWITTGTRPPTGAARKLPTIPAAPILVSGFCGSPAAAHTDRIRVTYVTANGESLPSVQARLPQNTDALLVVHSPPMVEGISGYNVYAAKDDDLVSAMGTLQNSSPIALGTNFKEPPNGWTSFGRPPPKENTAFIPARAPIAITQSGGYVDATGPNGPIEAFVLPANDAPQDATLTVNAAEGLPGDAPQPQSDATPGSSKPVVYETVGFASNQDVTFNGYPTFKLTIPKNVADPSSPYIVELYDGATHALMATMPAFSRQDLIFLSDYSTRFRVARNRRYYAELVAHSPFSASVTTATVATTLALPAIGGISASVVLPPAATAKNGAQVDVFASSSPVVGVPALPSAAGVSPLYYANFVIRGTAVPSGPADLTVNLPRRLSARELSYRLAAYDSGFASTGWHMDVAPVTVSQNVLRFKLDLPKFLAFRQYSVAFYSLDDRAGKGSPPGPPDVRSDAPDVVVVGDSLSILSILPPSSAGCVAGWGPLPQCQYSIDPSLNWPGYFAKMIGRPVRNLAQLGAETTVDEYFGASMLGLQIPQIEAQTQVVVADWGDADLGANGGAPATSARAVLMTNAILARAPRAHIIYIGIHCAPNCAKAGVDAWNDQDRRLAAKYGAFIDLRDVGPDGVNAAFPDGGHPSLDAARAIAAKVTAALRGLTLPRQ